MLTLLQELGKLGAKVCCLDFVKPSPQGTTWGEFSIIDLQAPSCNCQAWEEHVSMLAAYLRS